MPKFTVYYTNKEYGSLDVEAETEEQAKEKVESMWEAGDLAIYENKFEVHDVDLIKEKMPKYRITGKESMDVEYIIEAPTEGEAWEKLDACLNGRDWYPDESGKHIPCDPSDYRRYVIGNWISVPDTWELFNEDGERLL